MLDLMHDQPKIKGTANKGGAVDFDLPETKIVHE